MRQKYVRLITSKSLYFMWQDALSIQSEEKPLSMGSFLMERIFWLTPNGILMHILPGVQLRHSVPPVQFI